MIGGPLVLLSGLLLFKSGQGAGGGSPEAGLDPNQRIGELEKEVDGIRQSYAEFLRLTQSEDPRAGSVGQELNDRIETWQDEWGAIFDAHRDADGQLPDGLQAYQRTPARVQQIRNDLLKSSGM